MLILAMNLTMYQTGITYITTKENIAKKLGFGNSVNTKPQMCFPSTFHVQNFHTNTGIYVFTSRSRYRNSSGRFCSHGKLILTTTLTIGSLEYQHNNFLILVLFEVPFHSSSIITQHCIICLCY